MKTLDDSNLSQVSGGEGDVPVTSMNPRHNCADGASGTLVFIGADQAGNLYQCLHCGASGHLSDLGL